MKNELLSHIEKQVYDKLNFKTSNLKTAKESSEYDACQFNLGDKRIISRTAKVTPKKIGQFVTFWKRTQQGPIAPFDENDVFDFYTINVRRDNKVGQFVFPKSILIKKGIISTHQKEGKRGFRVYPSWCSPLSKQALKTQQWQINYFYVVNANLDLIKVQNLY